MVGLAHPTEKYLKYYFALILVLLTACSHPTKHTNNAISLSSKLEKLRVEYDVPGASIAIIADGKLLPPLTLGWANLEQKIPVRADTLFFQACSMTKTLTSTLVLMEFERRQLSSYHLTIPKENLKKAI